MTRKCWHLIKQKMSRRCRLCWWEIRSNWLSWGSNWFRSNICILSISRALAHYKILLIFYRNPFKNVCKSPNCNVVCSSNKGKTLVGFSRLKLNKNNPPDLHLAWPSLADIPHDISLSLSVCRHSVIRAGVSVTVSPPQECQHQPDARPHGHMLGLGISHGSLTPGIKTQSPQHV